MENNTATGVIASDKTLNLTVDNNVTNYGWISGKGDLNFNVLKGALTNRNAISSGNALAINAANGVENYKDIVGVTSAKLIPSVMSPITPTAISSRRISRLMPVPTLTTAVIS